MIVLPAPGSSASRKRKWLARQHLAVDGCDLVRQRFDLGGADGEIGIEQIGKPDAVGLGRKPQKAAIGIERVGTSSFQEFEAGLLASIDQALAHPTVTRKTRFSASAPNRDMETTSAIPAGSSPFSREPGLISSNVGMGFSIGPHKAPGFPAS